MVATLRRRERERTQAGRRLGRWHPSGVQDVWGRFPGVSLRETPGYRLSTLRVEQTVKASVLGQVCHQAIVSMWRRCERRARQRGEVGARQVIEEGIGVAAGLNTYLAIAVGLTRVIGRVRRRYATRGISW